MGSNKLLALTPAGVPPCARPAAVATEAAALLQLPVLALWRGADPMSGFPQEGWLCASNIRIRCDTEPGVPFCWGVAVRPSPAEGSCAWVDAGALARGAGAGRVAALEWATTDACGLPFSSGDGERLGGAKSADPCHPVEGITSLGVAGGLASSIQDGCAKAAGAMPESLARALACNTCDAAGADGAAELECAAASTFSAGAPPGGKDADGGECPGLLAAERQGEATTDKP